MLKLYINEQYITNVDYVTERLMSACNIGISRFLVISKANAPSDFLSNFPIEFLNENSINLIEIKDKNDVVKFSTTNFTTVHNCDIIRADPTDAGLVNQVLLFIKAATNKQST